MCIRDRHSISRHLPMQEPTWKRKAAPAAARPNKRTQSIAKRSRPPKRKLDEESYREENLGRGEGAEDRSTSSTATSTTTSSTTASSLTQTTRSTISPTEQTSTPTRTATHLRQGHPAPRTALSSTSRPQSTSTTSPTEQTSTTAQSTKRPRQHHPTTPVPPSTSEVLTIERKPPTTHSATRSRPVRSPIRQQPSSTITPPTSASVQSANPVTHSQDSYPPTLSENARLATLRARTALCGPHRFKPYHTRTNGRVMHSTTTPVYTNDIFAHTPLRVPNGATVQVDAMEATKGQQEITSCKQPRIAPTSRPPTASVVFAPKRRKTLDWLQPPPAGPP